MRDAAAPRRARRRRVPFALRCRLIFGGYTAWLGWAIAVFIGMIAAYAITNAEVFPPDYDERAIGRITWAYRQPPDRRGNIPDGEAQYTFTDAAGRRFYGVSYGHGVDPGDEGREVSVEYVAADPRRSRIVGLRSRRFGPGTLLILPLTGLGLAMAGRQARAGRRTLRLLARGVPVRGRLVDSAATGTTRDGGFVVALTFEYVVDGAAHRCVVEVLSFDAPDHGAEEPLLVDARAPAHATTLRHLPGAPRLGLAGELIVDRPSLVAALVLPLAFVAEMVVIVRSLLVA